MTGLLCEARVCSCTRRDGDECQYSQLVHEWVLLRWSFDHTVNSARARVDFCCGFWRTIIIPLNSATDRLDTGGSCLPVSEIITVDHGVCGTSDTLELQYVARVVCHTAIDELPIHCNGASS